VEIIVEEEHEAADALLATEQRAAGDSVDQPAPQPMTQRRVLGLATPIIGENLLQTMVGAVDTFLVARLGAYAVAGVGIGFEIVFFIISILSAIDIGATVLVAQSIGAGDRRRADHFARQAIVWGLAMAVPMSVILYFASPGFVSLFGTEADVAQAATTYMQITAAAAIVLFLSFVSGAVLRGAGDSRTPLAASVIANLVNVVLTYLLIFGHYGFPALGVAGSAIGAAVGRGCGAVFMLVAMFSGTRAISLRGRDGWRPEWNSARQLFRLGIPAATEQMLASASFMALVAVVALIGTAALAAQQISFTALSLAFLPGIGFSIAATALVGQSIGARMPRDARTAWRISLRWALVWMVTGSVFVFVLGERVMGVFSADPAVISAGTSALRALSFALPFWAVWFVSAGGLRGSGDTRTPLIIGASSLWLAVLLAWIGVKWFDAGMGWVWSSYVITTGPAAFIALWAFRARIGDYEHGRRELPRIEPMHS
jgi:multidrug resistance protein, MATE family